MTLVRRVALAASVVFWMAVLARPDYFLSVVFLLGCATLAGVLLWLGVEVWGEIRRSYKSLLAKSIPATKAAASKPIPEIQTQAGT